MNREYVLCANGSEAKFAVGPIKNIRQGDIVKVDDEFFEVLATHKSYDDDGLYSFLMKAEEIYPIQGWWTKEPNREEKNEQI